MGLIFGLMLTGLVFYGAYRYVLDPSLRSNFNRELAAEPLYSLWVGFGVLCCLTCLWGLLIPAVGSVRIPIGSGSIRLWQAAGLGAILWFISIGFVEHFRRRR